MADKSRSHYKVVAPNTISTNEVVIPNGETWEIDHCILSASPVKDTRVSIIFDYGEAGAQILFMTRSTLSHDQIKEVTGDGVKKLAIVLTNNDSSSTFLGGEFGARDI